MAKDIWAILKKRYPAKEYALMAEVSDAAGFHRSRSADYIAVNLWPSRGLSINGIELKSFRSDWLNELKNPKKAENIFQYCDYFWLLTTDETIADISEVPASWGWLCIKGERIIVKKDAPKLSPTTISKHFLAAMLKRAQDKTNFVHIDSISDKIEEAKLSVKGEREKYIERIEHKLKELTDSVNEFEQASGVDLRHYERWRTSPKKIGEAVKLIQYGGVENLKEQLKGLEKAAKIITERISDGLNALEI